MLDLGYGPEPGLWPDVDDVGKIDALLLSHGHRDHAGGLSLLDKIGRPQVYVTEIAAHGLPRDVKTKFLPLRGTLDVLGIAIQTGRSGHAPGGIWIHVGLAGGLLYMGDHCAESILYASDTPPSAETLILDASYGCDDTSLRERMQEFDQLMANGPVLLPVPADGRGPEIALFLAQKGRSDLYFDTPMRNSIRWLVNDGAPSLRGGVRSQLARVSQAAGNIEGALGIMLATRADATEGKSAHLAAEWERNSSPVIVFTGYIPRGTPAERLVNTRRAKYLCWNVHPRLSENAALIRSVGAKKFIAAFSEPDQHARLAQAFAPAELIVDTPIEL